MKCKRKIMVVIAFVAVALCILFQLNTSGRKKSELIVEEVDLKNKRKTPTITRTCALLLAAFASPFTAVLTAVLPFSTACSMLDRAADAPLDAALPPAVCAAMPDRAAA